MALDIRLPDGTRSALRRSTHAAVEGVGVAADGVPMPDIEVHPDGVRVTSRAGETVLAALSRSGYGYRVGCRRGGCGICKVDLRAGRVDYPVTVAQSVLPAGERRDGTCLSCRAVPLSDITITLRDDRLRVTAGILHAALARRDARAATTARRAPADTQPHPERPTPGEERRGGRPCP